MKQITCAVQDSFDAVKFLDEIKGSPEYKNAKSVLVNIFSERIQKDYIAYISELISNELKKRNQEKISLIMFDIDNFKRINDTYGHDMGDEVLVRIAQTAKNCIRSQDSIGRWGGEEFMILLPETEKIIAGQIAEKIRAAINALAWEKMPAISVSVGVAQVRDDEQLQDSYKRVDERLYYAKTHGKNQVCADNIASKE